ncbi:L,D-transpeptidase family protein [Flavobacterium sp. RHBU_3]|uniref:L,D-transpeptidase family protein n=1 Tax=Flavobacterium sp. RHBU_3 TaxID=3391184 RepID=UPI003984D70D
MKKIFLMAVLCITAAHFTSCKKKDAADVETHEHDEKMIALDTNGFSAFYERYPDYTPYKKQISELYKKHPHYIWHEKRGLIEFAEVLYNRVNQLDDEGLPSKIPYKSTLDDLFQDSGRGERPNVQSELLISAMYFYWADKTLEGLPTEQRQQTGWFLPRQHTDYVAYLDTLMQEPQKIKGDKKELFSQYYNLKKGLQKYREIEKKGGWPAITLPEGTKELKEGDSGDAVAQLRTRLAAEGYLGKDNKSATFDKELNDAVNAYEQSHFRTYANKVTESIIKELNIPVTERIKTIAVNMERCRWVPTSIDTQKEYIAVNIPSYRLRYVIDGKPELISNVVVGKDANRTVIFSGNMSYLVFSPYWNVPPSIAEKEIYPSIAKDPNYLAKHNMEYYNGKHIRQKPGGNNSLGLVKFMFPNTNNIYLHDTPAKSLFTENDRAFSHGCVRVQKARELAIMITKKDGGWNEAKVDKAMNAGKENSYVLKKKIPVYLTYFTAWADEKGNVAFFDDVYQRDESLATLMYTK